MDKTPAKQENKPVPGCKQKSTPTLSVVITVYSETYSVEETVSRILQKDRNYIKEIILIIHPDSTQECKNTCTRLAENNPLISMHYQQQTPGVGWAYREGMAIAQCDYIALMSADLETEPEAIDRMMRKLEETHCDIVVGNRWLKGGGFRNYDSLKLVLNWCFQKIFKTLYLTKLGDLTYGFKILSREAAKTMPWESTQHEIFIETTVKPLRRGFKIEQIPTVWVGRQEGVSKNTFLKNFRYVRLAIKILFQRSKR